MASRREAATKLRPMLPEATLHRLARQAASGAPSWLRDDIFQEVWVRFLRYRPTFWTWGWKVARGARADLCRQEGLQRTVAEALALGLPEAPSVYDRRRASQRRCRKRLTPDARSALNAYRRARYNRDPEAKVKTRERVRLHRQRVKCH